MKAKEQGREFGGNPVAKIVKEKSKYCPKSGDVNILQPEYDIGF